MRSNSAWLMAPDSSSPRAVSISAAGPPEPAASRTRSSNACVSALGMALTATSLVGMPFLGTAKQRLSERLGSSATHGEGAQNLICAYLAGAVFLGLAGNALFGWWWLDPIAALLIAGVAVKEGVETWRGEGCCAAPALAAPNAACNDGCC